MLEEIFKNCLYVEHINYKYIPVRFTAKQMKAYEKVEQFFIRANSCAGVSMDFTAKSRSRWVYVFRGIFR